MTSEEAGAKWQDIIDRYGLKPTKGSMDACARETGDLIAEIHNSTVDEVLERTEAEWDEEEREIRAKLLADVRREIAAATWVVEGKHLVQVPDILARLDALALPNPNAPAESQ